MLRFETARPLDLVGEQVALARERVDELRGFTPEAAAAAQLEADAWAEVGPMSPWS